MNFSWKLAVSRNTAGNRAHSLLFDEKSENEDNVLTCWPIIHSNLCPWYRFERLRSRARETRNLSKRYLGHKLFSKLERPLEMGPSLCRRPELTAALTLPEMPPYLVEHDIPSHLSMTKNGCLYRIRQFFTVELPFSVGDQVIRRLFFGNVPLNVSVCILYYD